MPKKVRVLLDTGIDGVDYKINQVILLPDAVAKPYIESGIVDAAKEAVAYAISEGAEVITHVEAIEAVEVPAVVDVAVEPAAQ